MTQRDARQPAPAAKRQPRPQCPADAAAPAGPGRRRRPPASPEGQALAALRRWNYQYTADAMGPSVFELWYDNLVKRLWDDDFATDATGPEMPLPRPRPHQQPDSERRHQPLD